MIDHRHGGEEIRLMNYERASRVLDFSVNVNPLGLPQSTKKSLRDNISNVTSYPDPGSKNLIRRIAGYHGIDGDNIAVGNGSIEFIYLIPRALKSRRALIIAPTFSEYEFAVRSNGACPIFVHTSEGEGFRLNIDRIGKYLSRTDLVFICNPNNPTGISISRDDMLSIFKSCRKYGSTLAVDEAFIDFTDMSDEISLFQTALKNRHLIIIRSLTKYFAMPGLRIGYMAAHKDIVARTTGLQYPWNVNSLAQAAGAAVLNDKGYIDRSREYISHERTRLIDNLNGIDGLHLFPSNANFVLCKLDKCHVKNAGELNRKLMKRGIIVRDCANFRGLDERFFRVAVRKRKDNNRLIEALKELL